MPGIYQYPGAIGDLVPGDSGRASGLGRLDCPAPRFVIARDPRLGGAGVERRATQGGGVHLQPRPGRGLPAGGTGAANWFRQGRSAVDATRRAFRPRARAALTGNAGAHPQPGVGGSRGRPGCDRPTAHRSAGITLQAAGCAGPTLGQHGLGRRVYSGSTVGRSARRLGLSRPHRSGLGLDPGVCAPWWPVTHRLSGLPPRGAR